MSVKIVIPARFGSSRLPGKPLLDIGGKPMLQWVYEQALKSDASEVVIATDDARIEAEAQRFGAPCIMTAASHVSGTDRIAEVAQRSGWRDDDIVINLQGDEPLMPPLLLAQVSADLASDPQASIATLCTPIASFAELHNPNCVKVVFNHHQHALYFSRGAIPHDRDGGSGYFGHRHLGLYAFRVRFLAQFTATPPCALEELEKLEQLRAMCMGHVIRVTVAQQLPGPGVDTIEDLEVVRRLMQIDAD